MCHLCSAQQTAEQGYVEAVESRLEPTICRLCRCKTNGQAKKQTNKKLRPLHQPEYPTAIKCTTRHLQKKAKIKGNPPFLPPTTPS
eukprot:c40348_g1_i1 orf=4-261(-)